MFKIDETTKDIYYIRGDTAHFTVSPTPFELEDGDTMTFTVKKKWNGTPIIEISSTDGSFTIEAASTKELNPGNYYYDCELETGAGEVYTLLGPAQFIMDWDITSLSDEEEGE